MKTQLQIPYDTHVMFGEHGYEVKLKGPGNGVFNFLHTLRCMKSQLNINTFFVRLKCMQKVESSQWEDRGSHYYSSFKVLVLWVLFIKWIYFSNVGHSQLMSNILWLYSAFQKIKLSPPPWFWGKELIIISCHACFSFTGVTNCLNSCWRWWGH